MTRLCKPWSTCVVRLLLAVVSETVLTIRLTVRGMQLPIRTSTLAVLKCQVRSGRLWLRSSTRVDQERTSDMRIWTNRNMPVIIVSMNQISTSDVVTGAYIHHLTKLVGKQFLYRQKVCDRIDMDKIYWSRIRVVSNYSLSCKKW